MELILEGTMKLSTRGRYGARFMLDLALNFGAGTVLLRDLAKRQELSVKYLDQIVGGLREAGLVKTKRGVKGGFSLAKPPEEIRLLEVVEAVEGPLNLVNCVAHPEGCPRSGSCVTIEVWEAMGNAMREVLSGITLAQLVHRSREKQAQ
jgi:Rrf2 family protein